jgi:prepilin peptidase CpaA
VTPAIWLVLAVCAVAVATDVTTRRIPNALTGLLAVGALAFHATHGWRELGASLVALVVVMLLGFFAFSLGWLGGGDVKLAAAAAAAFGYPDTIPFLIYTALAGGALALVVAAAQGKLREVFTSVTLLLRPLAYKGTVAVTPKETVTLPYAIAIATGALAVALSHTAAPFLRLPL